jgi:hypothetical protein
MSALSAYISHEYRKRYVGTRGKESSYTRNSKGSSAECSGKKESIRDGSNNGGEIL